MSKNVKILTAAATSLVALVLFAGCKEKPRAQAPAAKPVAAAQADATEADATVQKTCPVMEGNPIDKALFVEYKGQRVYFCCKGCEEKFLANPEQYIAKLPQFKQ